MDTEVRTHLCQNKGGVHEFFMNIAKTAFLFIESLLRCKREYILLYSLCIT